MCYKDVNIFFVFLYITVKVDVKKLLQDCEYNSVAECLLSKQVPSSRFDPQRHTKKAFENVNFMKKLKKKINFPFECPVTN